MSRVFVVLVLCVVFVFGGIVGSTGSWMALNRYRIFPAAHSSLVYRVDRLTGRTWQVYANGTARLVEFEMP